MSGPVQQPIWNQGDVPEIPALDGEVSADVCVIGLGGSGLSCLTELHDRGIDAVGVDAGSVGHGAAGRNGGILLSGLPDFYHRAVLRLGRERAAGLYRATLDQIDRMADETPEHVELTGSLRIAAGRREEADCRDHLDALRADGFPAEAYDGDEGHGLLIPTDGVYHPLGRCRALAGRLKAAGVRMFAHSAVDRIRAGRVFTSDGEVGCRRVVVAVDGGLERLLPDLSGRVRTARLQMLSTAPDPGVRLPRPVYARWGLDFWRQLPDDRLVVGGLRDAGGDDEWTVRATPSDTVQRELNYLLHRIGGRAEVTHRWAGVAAYTGDGLPVFDTVDDGILAIGAYSGTGNVMGAMLGREAALWAAGEASEWRPLLAAD